MKYKSRDYDKKESTIKWVITVSILALIISLLLSFTATKAISNFNIFLAIVLLLLVVLIGVLFDIIGIGVTIANENHFHAMASKKVKGAKLSVKLIKNSHKVSNFCADVIGDICGVLSGTVSAIIALKITEYYNLNFDLQAIITSIVSALTIGGKAIGKTIAKSNSTQIVAIVSKVLNLFSKEKSSSSKV